MRIWAFPSFYPYNHPGHTYTGIFAHRQYKGLAENGAEIKVILPIPWWPVFPFSQLHKEWIKYRLLDYPLERELEGIKIYHPRISNMKPNRFVKKSYNERFIDSIVGFFEDKKIKLNRDTDIFYSQWLPNSYLVQQAAHRLGVRSAVLSIGDDVVLWPHVTADTYKQFEKTMVEADLRFTCADYLGRLANKTLSQNLSYDVIMMGAQYDVFKPVSKVVKEEIRRKYNITGEKFVILMIGTTSVRKGWIEMLDALQSLKPLYPQVLLVGAHTGTPDFDLPGAVNSRGLNDQFIDLGEVPPANLSSIYNMADLFCLPSHSEGMANVVIEAMSSGLPVITTNVCGHPELIQDGITGILIPPKDAGILFVKLRELIDNRHLRESLGSEAREFIVNVWGNYAQNAKKLYDKLCK